jgi:hypothetical protein
MYQSPIRSIVMAERSMQVSEVFRVFQIELRTSRVADEYGKADCTQISDENRGYRMTADSASQPMGKKNALLAIAAGGLIAVTLDLLQACILFGWDIPLSIAGGLLGPKAAHGRVATYILGILLHFFIACSAASVYYVASRRLTFLKEHPLVCGLYFGATVEVVMGYVVLPLSALHARGPYELHDVLQGLLVHMVVVGLPISFSVRRFAK